MVGNVNSRRLDLNIIGNSVKSDDNKNSDNKLLITNTDIALIENNNQSSIGFMKENKINVEETTPKYIVQEYIVRFDRTGMYDKSLNLTKIMLLPVFAALLAVPVYVTVSAGILAGIVAACPISTLAWATFELFDSWGHPKWYEHTDFSGLSARDLRKLIEKIVERQYGQVKDLVIDSISPQGPYGKWDHIYSVKVRFIDVPDS